MSWSSMGHQCIKMSEPWPSKWWSMGSTASELDWVSCRLLHSYNISAANARPVQSQQLVHVLFVRFLTAECALRLTASVPLITVKPRDRLQLPSHESHSTNSDFIPSSVTHTDCHLDIKLAPESHIAAPHCLIMLGRTITHKRLQMLL